MSEPRSKFEDLLMEYSDYLDCRWYDGERAAELRKEMLDYVRELEEIQWKYESTNK